MQKMFYLLKSKTQRVIIILSKASYEEDEMLTHSYIKSQVFISQSNNLFIVNFFKAKSTQ